jgi:hypothetical protein
MTGYWSVTVVAAFRRLVAIAGADLSVGAVVAYVRGWVISTLHFAPDWNFGMLSLAYVLQVVVAGWVLWGSLKTEPPRLLRNVLRPEPETDRAR